MVASHKLEGSREGSEGKLRCEMAGRALGAPVPYIRCPTSARICCMAPLSLTMPRSRRRREGGDAAAGQVPRRLQGGGAAAILADDEG